MTLNMICRVTIQKLEHNKSVEIPPYFTGYQHIEQGLLYLIEFPKLKPHRHIEE